MISNDPDNPIILRSQIQAPLLWIILPLIAGYLIARVIPLSSNIILFSIGGFLTTFWIFAWWTRRHRKWYWKIIGVNSIFFLSWGYLLFHLPPNVDWSEKPEREAVLEIKIIQKWAIDDKFDRQSGYGEIVKAPKHLEMLIGQKISFCLSSNNSDRTQLIRTQIIKAKGILSSISYNSTNSFETYLFSQGIGFKLYRGKILKTVAPAGYFYRFCKKQNTRLASILNEGKNAKNSQAANIYNAMLLGNQVSLTNDQKYAFQITGSLHLFSISGLHVAMVGAFIAFFLKTMRIPSALAAIIGLLVLFLYIEITGGAPSAMRAFLMVAFYCGACVFQRKKSAFSALLGSALVALLINPFDLWNIGFQLSYGVVASILLYGVPLNEIINNWINVKFTQLNNKIKYGFRWVMNLIGISIAANIGSAFLSILYFKIFTPGAVLLSIAVIPLASLVMMIGCISLITGLLGLSFLSSLINQMSWLIIKGMEIIISLSLNIPGLFWESFTTISILTKLTFILVFLMLYLGHVFNRLQRSLFYSLPIIVIVLFTVIGRFFI